MTQIRDTDREMRIDPDSFSGGYFRNAVYRHWDPYEDIPEDLLEQDRKRIVDSDMSFEQFEAFRASVAKFGAGEEAVTEDLAPLMLTLSDINDQMFVSSQIYEEAKHTQFFDRYWRTVINPAAEAKGWEVTNPTDQRYFPEEYVELFDRTEEAMHRLLEDDTPTNRAKAFCHYHLVVESVLAQTGYWGFQANFSDEGPDSWADDEDTEDLNLDGLIEGITRIRSDEGRHVGFGMRKVQNLIAEEGVDPDIVQDTLTDLLPLVAGTVQTEYDTGADPAPLIEYAQEKLSRRIEIITDADAELPPVEELVKIEGADRSGAAGDD
ncbi:ribonucleoside-diphosphate reductase [Natronomonas amylolytica]|uniref:ribonucleoside-diphosphate reductase n=1 Tax=Natronomonas amylolytica TaxID=3108498 RepID=UPI00300960C2